MMDQKNFLQTLVKHSQVGFPLVFYHRLAQIPFQSYFSMFLLFLEAFTNKSPPHKSNFIGYV